MFKRAIRLDVELRQHQKVRPSSQFTDNASACLSRLVINCGGFRPTTTALEIRLIGEIKEKIGPEMRGVF